MNSERFHSKEGKDHTIPLTILPYYLLYIHYDIILHLTSNFRGLMLEWRFEFA